MQMSAKLASLSLALCAALVLVCTPAGAHGDGYQTYDCQARFGPACTDCINVTITFTHNRHLLASRKLQRGGRGRGGEGGPPAGAPTNRTITACTDCSGAANFELKERTEWTAANGGTPAGECSEFPLGALGGVQGLTQHCWHAGSMHDACIASQLDALSLVCNAAEAQQLSDRTGASCSTVLRGGPHCGVVRDSLGHTGPAAIAAACPGGPALLVC